MAIEVTSANYAETVERSDRLILLDVWAPWCAPCRAIGPVLDELAAEFEGKLTLAKINADNEPELAARLGVTGLPTIRLVQKGRVVQEWLGVTDKNRLAQAIGAALGAGAAR